MTSYYPIFLSLQDRLCLVIGGGEVAAHKVDALLAAGALVRVISPWLHSSLAELARQEKVEVINRSYQTGDLTGATLVIAATDNAEINGQVANECESLGSLCNVVDVPALCNFIVPAVLQRGPLAIAVSTAGMAPAVAKQIRRRLAVEIDDAYGIVIEALGQARAEILAEFNDPVQRRKLLTSFQLDELLAVYRSGGQPALEQRITEIIHSLR